MKTALLVLAIFGLAGTAQAQWCRKDPALVINGVHQVKLYCSHPTEPAKNVELYIPVPEWVSVRKRDRVKHAERHCESKGQLLNHLVTTNVSCWFQPKQADRPAPQPPIRTALEF